MNIKRSILIDWEKRFPALNRPWSHWWIEGDGAFLEMVSVDELGAALNVIKNNWKRFDRIKASPAKYEEDGSITRYEKRDVVIYNAKSHQNVEET